ncbi:dynein axonemal heavy chain 3 isoform X1 [Neodiprion lecontei]|uniref:Dynein axonemal heavy chain 3 isoform X1 n=2 Tax=Neodiprion lecontei TaxID=441921 RepID=A0A6J0B2A3_NEOLC|nr:dynein axonemal heavy chain 3 isoform X1 [Neodiprion lecontei]XP_046587582.1 dynein axonemal heavy chain 3 isoform X1 [Neodiprion lecontei]
MQYLKNMTEANSVNCACTGDGSVEPYKNWYEYVKPMESIGTFFTPTSCKFRIKTVTSKQLGCPWHPFGPDRKLKYPPADCVKAHYEEVANINLKKSKRLKITPDNIISLKDLADGTWERQKAEKFEAQILARKKNIRQKRQERMATRIPESVILAQKQAECPRDIEDQLDELHSRVNEEQSAFVRPEDFCRIHYLRHHSIKDSDLEPYDYTNIEQARARITGRLRLRRDFNERLASLEPEIIADYKESLRVAIVAYALLDPDERKRLLIMTLPAEYPIINVRAPVPWHSFKIIAEHFMEYNFFIGNEILQDIRDLWYTKYRHMLIVRPSDFGDFPVQASEIRSKIDVLCEAANQKIMDGWMSEVAEMFLEKKHAWKIYLSMKPGASTIGIENYFRCVNTLLSKSLRDLIVKTLIHLKDFIVEYSEGNDFTGEYQDMTFIRKPCMTVRVEPVLGTNELKLTPDSSEICRSICYCFERIIKIGDAIPKIEGLLFPEIHVKSFMSPVQLLEPAIQETIDEALNTFKANINGPHKYLKMYDNFLYILDGQAEHDLENYFALDPLPALREFGHRIEGYDTLIRQVFLFRNKIPLNIVELDCTELNETLRSVLRSLRTKICNHFYAELRANNQELCTVFEEIADKVSEMPETTQEVIDLFNYLSESRDCTMFNLRSKSAHSVELILFLIDYQPPTNDEIILNTRTLTWPKEMEAVMELANTRLNLRKEFVEGVLRIRRDNFETRIHNVQNAIDQFKKKDPPVLTMDEMESGTEEIEEISKQMAEIRKEAEEINREEALLDMELSPYMILPTMSSTVDVFDRLWHTITNFHKNYEKWYYGPFKDLDAEEVREETENSWRTLYKLSRLLTDTPGARRIAEMVRGKVEKFKQFIPLLQTICNPGLQQRHWEQISQAVEIKIIPNASSSLGEMVDFGLPVYINRLEEISMSATKEYGLEKNLRKMQDEWSEVYFDLTPYRETGVHILSAVDDIQMLLDDHILKAQTMRGSPYVKAFEHAMQAWEEKLMSMQDIIDQWLYYQATWMYLEPIFSSEDIMRQMPTEAKNFRVVDKIWRQIMTYVASNRKVTVATSMPDMLKQFKSGNTLLDEIQKRLNDYLEKKRLFFPRFFFLSNDELLEILSETKDPQRVQPHLKKCFEGISKLRFTKEQEIIGMLSDEDEYVPMSTKIFPADAKGLVEKWLSQVEKLMKVSLRDVSQDSIAAYFNTVREVWILSWPGQIVLCGSQVHWTSEVCESFEANSVPAYLAQCSSQIDKTVALVRGKLEPGARITLNALIVIDVHARDVVKLLVEKKVTSVTDFNWISQLRYYWIDDSITVSMITTEVAYAYEYLGNSPRLVITPLTDRCYRTLMGALKLYLGGAPEGPAGTGKTETSKDLAKAVAKQCVVFNCSDGLDYKAMGKFFKGLAQSGAWSCFDEFNRIELEVLSVIAQQILTIQMAVGLHLEKFIFEGTEIKLDPTCNIFITMNPGYAGRQELPDNLKVLFRTVAMMVPDYGMIGEITLYSYGFIDARSLAEKIVHTYKLCSEQLSSQCHYDYGMRAVKTVLLAAGNLKLKYTSQNESILVLRAIVDVNLPKFLAQDVPLFNGIYSDLFPGIDLPQPDRVELIDLLKVNCQKRNLQATDWFIEKVIQIYEMILVRHGLMIVGEPMGGKTQAYQSLADSLGDLSTMRRATMREFRTVYRIINPKAITMGQLYGSFDPISHEWSDGVLANTFREYAQSLSIERKWILFDGPVDAVWIENMNTVLDDNKKLCLMSGEIIQMSNRMNLIFEPADLEQASPATVSRCGMIYMEPSQLGWHPFFESYKKHLKEKLLTEQFGLLVELVEWLTQSIFDFVRLNCKTFIETSELHMFHSFTRMLTTMLEGEGQVSTVWLQCTLLFSMIWGMCPTLVNDSRKLFDIFLRKLLDGGIEENPKPKAFKLTKQQLFPDKGTVFDWVYDKKNNGTWISWADTTTQVQMAPNAKVGELIIQTNEMCMQRFFLSCLLPREIPLLFVGPTGTGKSAIVLNYLVSLAKEKFTQNAINFSARTSAFQTQEIVMSKLDRRRKGVYGPTMGKQCVLFVDDLSMPQKEVYGAQPPIELLRQWIDHGYWFDPKDTTILYLVDILMIAAMIPPGGGSNVVTSRLTRHMHIIGIDSFDDSTMTKIFTSILDWHLAKGFDSNVARLGKMVVAATIDLFHDAIENFLPTPAKSHYTFSLRDFSRVIRGIVLVPSSRMKDPDKMVRLWIHEAYRVFYDRLIDDNDRETLFKLVKNACYQQLRQSVDKVLGHFLEEDEKIISNSHIRKLFFGNYMEPDVESKIYDEVVNEEDLQEKMEYYLTEYNIMAKTPMSLVLFRYAIEHISRISRILLQDNGHALLVGIGGSGRSSCARLATSMCEYLLYQVEMTRTYGQSDWRDDLKALLLSAGGDGKITVFLFGDNQIKDESFVEDINMILNTGDVPNLYASDEKAEILEKMMNTTREGTGKKMETTPMALYNFFIERVKNNLHVVLTMSPIGDAFRNRLRMFPSLINCCTIDWYTAWPEDALEKVAKMFLKDLDITSELRAKSVLICKQFHTSVQTASEDYFVTQRRKNYVTPTSFLELIKSIHKLYGQKIEQITLQQNRYEVGLDKLDFAAAQVGVMQEELHALQPKLLAQSQLSDKLMIRVEQDTVTVEAKKEVVAADEALANEAAAAAQAIKDDCESDLAEATPALEAALSALNTLKPSDIVIVKSMKNPPAGVRLVMEAVCVLKGVKPVPVQDPTTGGIVDDYWAASIKMLGDMKFLESLKTFNKDNIPTANIKKIREKYMNDRAFVPEVIKKSSTACEGLCKWVRAMEVYDRVIKVVAPKKAMLAEAEGELLAQLETLNAKRALLQEVTDKLQSLNDEFAECMREKKKLEDLIDHCMQKLDRAEKLLGGLGGEKTRWSETAAALGESLGSVIGDVILGSGIIAYLGAFTIEYRNSLIKQWHESCSKLRIPCDSDFGLVKILGEPVEIRAWMIHGLPADTFSVENAIIVKNANRWPLMIDPQGQANKWVKNMEKQNKLNIIKLTDPNYVRIMELAIQYGNPVLLENILEEIDAILEPVLVKNIYKQQGVTYMKFGENVIEYHTDFRFYITTRLRNPHYLPEVAVKVSLLNFMITPQGLQDQLLGIVVAKDLPVLEEKKNQLIIEGANNKRILKEIEDKILEVLSTSEGNILEDETAVKILSSSKVLSAEIQAKQAAAMKTTLEIDDARNKYKPVSFHGAVLFFCISELANIDPMYQYSLAWFIHLYTMAILNSEKSVELNTRMKNLNTYFTASIYRNVCRSLFEKDKLIFSFVLCIGLMRADNKVEEDLWVFLLTGGVTLQNAYKNPAPSWLSEKSWSEVVRSSRLTGLGEFQSSVENRTSDWKAFYDLADPQDHPLPSPFTNEVHTLNKLVILRCIRPDKIVSAVQTFITHHMGQSFIEPPPFDLQDSYNDSSNISPLVFILSPGSDPMAGLIKFAEDRGIQKKNLMTISLGQGQGPIAAGMINKGIKNGEWVVLQNCHLAESWMKELDRICDEVIIPENTHSKFRIWLTSYPSKAFPVSILQNGVKMTNEAPKGLKQNLLRSYLNDPISDMKFFNNCYKISEWRTLLFSLCFFHAVVQERRKFGPLGWNIPYEFNESDLRISVLQLQMFLNEYQEVPFEALLYLTGECNYGGRVTDDKDRRLMSSLLQNYYCEAALKDPEYSFSASGMYHLPPNTDMAGCLQYIRSLPINQLPEVYGLHANADITKDNKETSQLLAGVLLTQTQISGGTGDGDTGEMVINLAETILSSMPPQFDVEYVARKYPVLYSNSMNTVLRQELIRFNRLTEVIKSTLKNVQKAIRGQVVMSESLEEVYINMNIGKVPACWDKKSYPSLKPLGSYITDLLARLEFLQKWIENDAPVVFWLSGFFFTQSFLTGVLQNFARKHKIPIDHLDFEFKVTQFERSTDEPPSYGVYTQGLFLEGARWDRKLMALNESLAKIMFDVVPIIWLMPGKKIEFKELPVYHCPVYKTSARRGVLATTGHSSNFVMYILLTSNHPETHWINRGVACLCQLDD